MWNTIIHQYTLSLFTAIAIIGCAHGPNTKERSIPDHEDLNEVDSRISLMVLKLDEVNPKAATLRERVLRLEITNTTGAPVFLDEFWLAGVLLFDIVGPDNRKIPTLPPPVPRPQSESPLVTRIGPGEKIAIERKVGTLTVDVLQSPPYRVRANLYSPLNSAHADVWSGSISSNTILLR